MSRKTQLWYLIGLSAATAVFQYVVQGAMASGGVPSEFSTWFWYADYGLWGARALIEAWVIVYLFTTQARSKTESIVIVCFEVGLIVLITLTLGPAWYALTVGLAIQETMSDINLRLWTFGIAAYTSLMMGSAGFAYKIQGDKIKRKKREPKA